MRWHLFRLLSVLCLFAPLQTLSEQAPPPASAARILLLPKRIVGGEPATLAVLDGNGRLTPGVTVNFSYGDHLVTNATGRALFVAPVNPGVIYATIGSRSARVYTTILTTAEVSSSSLQVSAAPEFASRGDRFELAGTGFCGDADANNVRVAGKPALVLASSRAAVTALPSTDVAPGPANIEVSCAKRSAPTFSITFVDLSLDADSSPLAPGEHRTLTIDVRGTIAKVPLEARNLSPKVADLTGGNPAKTSSSGGAENAASFELIGRERGNFSISVRLLATPSPLRR
ncbi:MAG: hypothetical protein JWO71_1391 [Candidatus Acidoferrum typicum]|nr:hypothetical protein [Candidatus Acidoferrum typicum]